jgi:DHA2 family multidrug resistance protein
MATAAAPSPRRSGPIAAPANGAALPVHNRGLLTLGVMLATIMQILDTTIANVALPHMQTALGATTETITWVLTSYIVASAIAIPITGWLSDTIGSRNLFLLSVIGFLLASLLCGIATSLPEMVAFRILQGISAAFINPLSQTVMLDINAPDSQAKAMSIWGMGIMVGPILGPVFGGWLTDNFDWRWVFLVNLPIGVVTMALLWFLLPSRPLRRRPFDHFGFGLLALGIASLQLMFDRGQSEDWFQSTEIWIEAMIALIAFWMFVVHLITGKRPMFDRAMLANRNMATGIFFMLVIGVVMMATMALLPPMLQTLFGYPVLDTGLLLMPRGVGILATMFVSGQLMQRQVDARWMVGIGLVITVVSLWQMTFWTLEMGPWPFIWSGLVQGLGMGLVFMPLNSLAFATLAPEQRTEGASLLNLSRAIGSSIGISVVTTVLARSLQTSHSDLAQNITPEKLNTFDPTLLQALGGSGDALMGMVDLEINRQAMMIAYLNDFWLMMIVTICIVPLVFLLKKPKGAVKADPAAAGH